jgi:DNA invertase Pin-like site-specific DNA recombinase
VRQRRCDWSLRDHSNGCIYNYATLEKAEMVRGQTKFVAYYRVSTDKQGERGLGMAAQQSDVERFVAQVGGKVIASFPEVESGKRDENRPQLQAALARAKVEGATLLIAKLDRLSRDAHFLMGLQKAEVDFVAVDMPDANKLTIGIMALIAQHEREAISARTKAALRVAREKVKNTGQISGPIKRPHVKRLGNPYGARALLRNPEWRKIGQPRAAQARKDQANARALELAPILAELEIEGFLTASAKAAQLNERAFPTPRKGKWEARTVIDALRRIKDISGQNGLA